MKITWDWRCLYCWNVPKNACELCKGRLFVQ